MKKVMVVSLLLIAVLGGYGMGYAYRCASPAGFVAKPIERIERVVVTNSVPVESSAREKELLLQAIDELNLTTTELEKVQAQLEGQAESVRRYNCLMDMMQNDGLDSLRMLSFGFSSSYMPNKELLEFFGWKKETVEQIEALSKKTQNDVREWESKNAVYIESGNDELIYELPAAPQEFKQRYLDEMTNLIPEADLAVMQKKFEDSFEHVESRRQLKLSIGPADMPHMRGNGSADQLYMIVKTVYPDGHSSFGSTQGPTSYMRYEEGRTIPVQYNHIFNLEIDPDAGEPFYSR